MRPPIDTSVEARERQLEAYRTMKPEARLQLAEQMSADVRSLARSGIRARRGGEVSDDAVDDELARIILGPKLAALVRARPRTSGR